MLQSLIATVDSRLAGQEIPRLLWTPKVHYYRAHNSPPLDPIRNQLNPIYALTLVFVASAKWFVPLMRIPDEILLCISHFTRSCYMFHP